MRATCGLLNIGNASALSKARPDLVGTALAAVRSRAAYRATPFADDVSTYLAPPQRAGGPAGAAGGAAAAVSTAGKGPQAVVGVQQA